MVGWETAATDCQYEYSISDVGGTNTGSRSCPRSALAGHERCPYHLPPQKRDGIDVAADLRKRLAAVADGDRTIFDEPLSFREVKLLDLDLSGLDFSQLANKDIDIDLRGSHIEGDLRINDCTMPFLLDLRGVEVGGETAIVDSDLEEARFARGEFGTAEATSLALKLESVSIHDISGRNAELDGKLRVTGGRLGNFVLDKATFKDSLTVSNTSISVCSLRDITLESDDISLLSEDIGRVKAGGVDCQKLKIGQGVDVRLDDTDDTPQQALEIDLKGATVSERLEIREIDVNILTANQLTAEDVKIFDVDFASVSEDESPVIKLSDGKLQSLECEQVDAPGAVLIEQTDVQSMAFDDCVCSSLTIKDGEAKTVTVGGAYEYLRLRDFAVTEALRFEDCTLGTVGFNNLTLSRLVFQEDCRPFEGARSDAPRSVFHLKESTVDSFEWRATVDHIRIYRSELSETATFRRFTCSSLSITHSEVAAIRIDGECVNLTLHRTELTGESNVLITGENDVSRRVHLSDSRTTKTAIRTGSGQTSVEVADTRIRDEVLFKTSSGAGATADDECRIFDCSVTDLTFDGAYRSVEIEQSQVAETASFHDCRLGTLCVKRSQIPRLDLTTRSDPPIAEEIEFVDADLPKAVLETGPSPPLATAALEADRVTLREADMRNLAVDGKLVVRDSNLTDAQLQNADLRGADLSNTLLSRANLADAQLQGADLKGAVVGDAQVTSETEFGTGSRSLLAYDPRITDEKGDGATADTYWLDVDRDPKQAKSIYRRLESLATSGGQSSVARQMHKNRKEMSRRLITAGPETGCIERLKCATYRAWYWSTGHGIEPGRVLCAGLVIMFLFAVSYFLPVLLFGNPSWGAAAGALAFSIGVFFSLEPAFFTPLSVSQYLVAIEAGFGAIAVAVLIYTIGQRASL